MATFGASLWFTGVLTLSFSFISLDRCVLALLFICFSQVALFDFYLLWVTPSNVPVVSRCANVSCTLAQFPLYAFPFIYVLCTQDKSRPFLSASCFPFAPFKSSIFFKRSRLRFLYPNILKLTTSIRPGVFCDFSRIDALAPARNSTTAITSALLHRSSNFRFYNAPSGYIGSDDQMGLGVCTSIIFGSIVVKYSPPTPLSPPWNRLTIPIQVSMTTPKGLVK